MEYLNNETSRVTIYMEDDVKTEIESINENTTLLVVVDSVGILLVYEMSNPEKREAKLHSGYNDWLKFETEHVGGDDII